MSAHVSRRASEKRGPELRKIPGFRRPDKEMHVIIHESEGVDGAPAASYDLAFVCPEISSGRGRQRRDRLC